jgi:hypothetical protein
MTCGRWAFGKSKLEELWIGLVSEFRVEVVRGE